MRFRVLVTRVQVAERWIRATDEEDAAAKVRAEFERPYAYLGSWRTASSEVEIVETQAAEISPPNPLSAEGPWLLSPKDAAYALGISYSMIYDLTSQGDLVWTWVGSRKYVAKDALHEFIKQNSHRGYAAR